MMIAGHCYLTPTNGLESVTSQNQGPRGNHGFRQFTIPREMALL
jgi:hypothetical protein